MTSEPSVSGLAEGHVVRVTRQEGHTNLLEMEIEWLYG
jgi:hypothetical protein